MYGVGDLESLRHGVESFQMTHRWSPNESETDLPIYAYNVAGTMFAKFAIYCCLAIQAYNGHVLGQLEAGSAPRLHLNHRHQS